MAGLSDEVYLRDDVHYFYKPPPDSIYTYGGAYILVQVSGTPKLPIGKIIGLAVQNGSEEDVSTLKSFLTKAGGIVYALDGYRFKINRPLIFKVKSENAGTASDGAAAS